MNEKLIRDKIHERIIDDGGTVTIRCISDHAERMRFLAAKVREEADELIEAILEDNLSHILEELTDMEAVATALIAEAGATVKQFEEYCLVRERNRGGLTKFIVKTTEHCFRDNDGNLLNGPNNTTP